MAAYAVPRKVAVVYRFKRRYQTTVSLAWVGLKCGLYNGPACRIILHAASLGAIRQTALTNGKYSGGRYCFGALHITNLVTLPHGSKYSLP